MQSAIVIGAGSAIGNAWAARLAQRGWRVWAVSRAGAPHPHANVTPLRCDHGDADIARIVERLRSENCRPERIGIFLGMLHADRVRPEKRIEDLDRAAMAQVIGVNSILPALWLKHLLPLIALGQDCRIAVLSARVGSIGDNRLGGWYSYRASKAALNMLLQCAAVEFSRRAKQVKLVSFHPGTTDTPLSRPFQANVPAGKLFDAAFVAERLDAVLDARTPDGVLSFVDYEGRPIDW